MTRILFYLEEYSHDIWRDAFHAIDPTIDFRSYPDWGDPENTTEDTYSLVWQPKPGLLKEYSGSKVTFSIGAGIDHIMRDPNLPDHIPIVRMADDGLKEGMAEFVVMSVLMLHRGMVDLIDAQSRKHWARIFAPAASSINVGIMGYGALGQKCAAALKPLGYKINSWSTSPKAAEDGVTHYQGMAGLEDFLANTNILVGILPNTQETTGLLNMETLQNLPKRASIINAGRGNLIVIDDLIKQLDLKHLSGAILDVFEEEPVDKAHPLWEHPKILITPHIAAVTRPKTAAEYVLRNIENYKNGRPLENVLDLKRGY
ncbi:glyoxylate/hydroxypyruvate reductase A [Kordiimonas sp. SCSIO 12610]|uniref:2-hydroxyacid dehydrogenase n=1 Tax=Kordiimonas sp. SCSIO 12610 TaxID=2829597 RepID=UPI00210D9082|nr:glyoxylate/hydroxypyruvate reductase A [Kordiimonas sp. SCSIO 12610]UTW56424.1 glyoxylate/hydroxypyruvate reductase A [Kordiimonas sp. SCSIO 12610]